MSDTAPATSAVPEPMIHVRAESEAPPVKPVLDALEHSIVQFAIETKLRSVLSTYMKTVVLPIAGVIAAAAGYMGFQLDAKLDELRTAQNQVTQLERDTAEQKKELESVSDRLGAMVGTIDNLEEKLGLTSRDLETAGKASDRLQEVAESQRSELATSGKTVLALALASDQVRAQHETSKQQLVLLQSETSRLQNELAKAEANATRLQKIADFQARLLTSNVVESVSLNSDDKSGDVRLPRRNGGEFKVVFTTPTIKPTFTLTYSVDGQPHSILASNDMRGRWIPIEGTDGQYEFTLDNLYYSRTARNFITIRIRGTERLVDSRAP